MRRIIVVGLVVIAALAVMTSTVSAHVFVASKTGKITTKQHGENPGEIQWRLDGDVIYCSEQTGTGEITSLRSETFKETVTYKGCTGGGGNVNQYLTAYFEYNANESVRVEKRFGFKPEGYGCEFLIEPQTITGFSYENVGSTLRTKVSTTGFYELGTGGFCGGNKEKGVYDSDTVTTLAGGTLKWE